MAQPCMLNAYGAALYFYEWNVSDEEALHDDDVVVATVVFDP